MLANDHGEEPTIVGNTEPLHGSLELEDDGGFIYTPEAGFSGTDSFEYTIADAVHLCKTDLPLVGIHRGPNVESPLTTPTQTIDVLPEPSYDPSIARFSFEDSAARRVEEPGAEPRHGGTDPDPRRPHLGRDDAVRLQQKDLPANGEITALSNTGATYDGEYLEINMSALPAQTSTATVTINVNEAILS